MRRRRNLILGAAEALSWPELEPFVVSLGETSFSGDVVIFAADLDREATSELTQAGIDLRPMRRLRLPARGGIQPYDLRLARFHAAYSRVIRSLSRLARDRALTTARLAAAISVRDVRRFLLYYRYLSARQDSYRYVMLTDVRDVVFQSDPFDSELGDELLCFLEDERQPIARQPHNRKWVQTAFGPDVLRELGALPVVCAGVTIGPSHRVLGYLRVMIEFLSSLPTQRTGLDQAVHNYVIHKGLVPDVRLVSNGSPLVATLGTVPPEDVGRYQGTAVLHQYDRHPALAATLIRRYRRSAEATATKSAARPPSVAGS